MRALLKALRLVKQNRQVAMDTMMKFSELDRELAARTYNGMVGTFTTNGVVDEATGVVVWVASLLSTFGHDYAPQRSNSCLRQEHAISNYHVETLSSLSTLFFTVGRRIMRSCQAV